MGLDPQDMHLRTLDGSDSNDNMPIFAALSPDGLSMPGLFEQISSSLPCLASKCVRALTSFLYQRLVNCGSAQPCRGLFMSNWKKNISSDGQLAMPDFWGHFLTIRCTTIQPRKLIWLPTRSWISPSVPPPPPPPSTAPPLSHFRDPLVFPARGAV